MYANLSLPLIHLIPSVRLSNEKLATKREPGAALAARLRSQRSMPSPSIGFTPCDFARAKRYRYMLHCLGVSQELQ